MTTGLMRRLFSSSTRTQLPRQCMSIYLGAPHLLCLRQYQRTIAHVCPQPVSVSKSWFTSSTANLYPGPGGSDHPLPDERILKLGKTIRTLHDRLPTLLASPLPQDILSPHISLHLFPSTHPHLPSVTGKLAYTAALWTAPVAWGRVPVVGNVKLQILSERMVKNGGNSVPACLRNEKLIVKWQTCGKSEREYGGQVSEAVEKMNKIVGGAGARHGDEEFCGLFIFEFDEEGRIITHTIEHAEENGNWDKTTRVISVTDWLLGKAWGRRGEEGSPGLAFITSERYPKRNPLRRR